MLAMKVDAFVRMASSKKLLPYAHEFGRDGVATRVIQKETIAGELTCIPSGDEIDQQPSLRKPIEAGRHARRQRRLHQTRAQGHEKP